MGEIYARLQGENEAVCVAMREEYLPTSAEGELPQTNVGAVLSIADKVDSIQAFFSAGVMCDQVNTFHLFVDRADLIVKHYFLQTCNII